MTPEKVSITTEFIRLDALLKFVALAASGGEAKQYIAAGGVLVNGQVCLQRGKKLRPGDVVEAQGRAFEIEAAPCG